MTTSMSILKGWAVGVSFEQMQVDWFDNKKEDNCVVLASRISAEELEGASSMGWMANSKGIQRGFLGRAIEDSFEQAVVV